MLLLVKKYHQIKLQYFVFCFFFKYKLTDTFPQCACKDVKPNQVFYKANFF